MVDLSDFLEPEETSSDAEDAADLAALKSCLKALADAIASSNLAILTSAHGDTAGAGARVQASVAALKRFSEAFIVLEGEAPPGAEPMGED